MVSGSTERLDKDPHNHLDESEGDSIKFVIHVDIFAKIKEDTSTGEEHEQFLHILVKGGRYQDEPLAFAYFAPPLHGTVDQAFV